MSRFIDILIKESKSRKFRMFWVQNPFYKPYSPQYIECNYNPYNDPYNQPYLLIKRCLEVSDR